jgi:hypothetical protein
MNIKELKNKLNENDKIFIDFIKDFGGGYQDLSEFLGDYKIHPDWETIVARLLDFPTEEEKRTQATIEAAKGAKCAAIAALISALISLSVLLITLLKK